MGFIPLNFAPCIYAFSKPIYTNYKIGRYINGVWEEHFTLEPPACIDAIILATDVETMRIYSNGEATAGGISITTSSKLYYTDITADSQTKRQSYVYYKDYIFRVLGKGLTLGNTNLEIYYASRYIE